MPAPRTYHVDFRGRKWTDAEFERALTELPPRPGAMQFSLEGNRLTARALTILAKADLPAILLLNLDANPIGDEGLQVLAATPRFDTIGVLHLRRTGISAAGLSSTLSTIGATWTLRDLDVSENPIGDVVIDWLMSYRSRQLVTHLALEKVGLSGQGAGRLAAASAELERLAYLVLRGNDLPKEVVKLLRGSELGVRCKVGV
jgi:Ran GTPase-activating protein (RanGAP) involved in mRNA processing and transport